MGFGAMPLKVVLLCASLFAALPSGSVEANAQDDCGDDQECLQRLYDSHPVKDARTLRSYQALPIDRRVVVAPAKLLDYLNLDNRLRGFPNRPRYTRLDPQFLQDMTAALAGIPSAVKTLVDSRLMGIFLVQDLGGTGYTDYVYDGQRQAAGAFIVLDADVLTRVANQWATWKENTPFNESAEFGLEAIIEDGTGDNRTQALQYILLHELGHVASVGRKIHPPWDGWDCVTDPPTAYAFFGLSWELSGEPDCKVISKFDHTGFHYRTEVVYYFGARLPLSDSPAVYAELERTNFPSLYAATSPADDFAESFATYVHAILMGKPFSIRIEGPGEVASQFTGCWGTERCQDKQAMIAELLQARER
jgi:hypothetical protein